MHPMPSPVHLGAGPRDLSPRAPVEIPEPRVGKFNQIVFFFLKVTHVIRS